MAEYPLLTLELRRRAHRGRRVAWWVTAVIFFALGMGSAILMIGLHRLPLPLTLNTAYDLLGCYLFFGNLLLFLRAPSTACSLFAAERENGTLELLLLSPLSTRRIVMEKFLAGMQNMLLDGCYFLPFILLLVSSFQREILWLLLCGTVDLVATTALYIGIGAQASAAHRTTRLATISAYAVIFGTTIGGVILTALSGALRLLSDNEWGLFLVLHMSMCGTMTILFLSGAIGDIARLRNEPAEEWDVNSSFREMGGDHTPHS